MADQTIVTQSTTQVHPSNGVKPGTPQPSSEPKPATAAADPMAEREAKLQAREEALNKRDRVWRDEAKKTADEKKGLGAKLSRLSELEKREEEHQRRAQLAKLNPPEFLKSIYGERAQEIVTSSYVNGVAPAELITTALQGIRDEFRQELAQRDEKAKTASTEAERAAEAEARAEVAHNCARFYEAQAADYPVFKKLGDAARVGQMLGQRIEQEFRSTGKLLSEKDAADLLEGDVMALLDEALGHDKYKTKLQSKMKPANVSTSSGASGAPQQSSQRRTLDNSMTASTSGRAPPRSDDERFQRSMERFNEIRAKGNT